jgi:hypothetical protein
VRRKSLHYSGRFEYSFAMQESAAASSSATAGSFASVLAAFSPPAAPPRIDWSEDDLGDDIATLSYEQALRTHSRNRTSSQADWSRQQKDVAGNGQLNKPASGTEPLAVTAAPARCARPQVPCGVANRRASSPEDSRKAASITIRLSRVECAKLHDRAAEAGLTVSAYLRSCTLEVEALRAQVKEALSQLRPAADTERQEPSRTKPHAVLSWRDWLLALFRPRQSAGT